MPTADDPPLIDLTEPDAAPPTPPDLPAGATSPIRVHCHQHRVCLYAGDTEPEGGAAAVAEAAGCPAWVPLEAGVKEHDPAVYAECPVPARLAEQQRAEQDQTAEVVEQRRAAAGTAHAQERTMLDEVVARAVSEAMRALRAEPAVGETPGTDGNSR